MKALLFTLLLLFVVFSPSFTTPTPPPHLPPNLYTNRQRIIYTIFTIDGVVNIECLWDPSYRELVPNSENMRIESRGGENFQRVTIDERSVQLWTFNTNPPGSENIHVSARLQFRHEIPSFDRTLVPGVTVIDPNTVEITERTSTNRDVGEHPMVVTFVFMAILPTNSVDLHRKDERVIRERWGPGAPRPEKRILPLQLDGGIWVHLLSNRMSEYPPGAIECEPAPENQNPRLHPDEICDPLSSRPRNPEDPVAQEELKRQCRLYLDSNGPPEGQGEAGGPSRGGSRRQMDLDDLLVNDLLGDRVAEDWFEYEAGVREENFAALDNEDLYSIARLFKFAPMFPLLEILTMPFRKKNTSSLKRPRQMICHEVSLIKVIRSG
jgi:hypothetical protein